MADAVTRQLSTGGSTHTKSPESFNGLPFNGGLTATDAAVPLPVGLTGITLTNAHTAVAYVYFNNHPMNADVDGLRYEIPANKSITITFDASPRPTSMGVTIAGGRVSYTGGAE